MIYTTGMTAVLGRSIELEAAMYIEEWNYCSLSSRERGLKRRVDRVHHDAFGMMDQWAKW